ncbi:hypothetical protein BN10_480005 [Phycicoccus elongatus Lp2]|uniref:Uncharacterized protein n=1 Tax=Phycicoccus elongatus Lp2 TaxID=1193181 RepID=N0E2J5_9MICO|nr:hypothetical protein BN10_480005 [Phycicoccus elongatus Lp2]
MPMCLAQREPRDVDGLLVRVVLDRQVATDGLEQVVVDVLVDPAVPHREPIVDRPQLDEHAPLDAGLLGHFARGRLRQRLLALDVPLRQAPFDAAGPIAPGDDGDAGLAFEDVDDDATGGAFLDAGQPSGNPGGFGGCMTHNCHCNQSERCDQSTRGRTPTRQLST